ncbi:MAG: PAS domain S-box protein [Calditrichae bacterium]|nr:PAS domain S-box protein [Calditrichia bacterium]
MPAKILIIDDEQATLIAIKNLLKPEGYDLHFANNGADGLDEARKLLPDVILSDIVMNRMDGYEFCKEIRSDNRLRQVPIILFTALYDQQVKLKGLEAGADDVIPKPVDAIELRTKLRTLTELDRFRKLYEDRKQLEETNSKLAMETNRRRVLFEQSPDGILIIDLETAGFLEFNTAAHAQLGYSREEFAKLTIFDIEAQETEDETRSQIEKVVQSGRADFETLQRTKQGEIRNTHVTAQSVEILGKSVYYCTWRDITEQKKAEQALKLSEEKFKYIFDNSVVAKSITELNGQMHANDAFYHMLGYTRKELLKMSWQAITHPEDMAFSENATKPLINGKKDAIRFIKRYIHKNGKTIWVDANTSIRRDEKGNPLYFISTALDITERKEAEEALIESERKLSTLMNNLPGMAYRCKNDHNWTMEFVSGGCKKLTGYEQEALINNSEITFDEIIHPEDRQYVWDSVQEVLDKKQAYELTYRIITASNETRWVWERGAGIFDKKTLLGLEGFITDITEQKQAEDLLRASEERYRHTLDNMLEGCRILDHDFRYIYVNESAARHGRTTPENLLGKTIMEAYPGIEETEMFSNLRRCMDERVPQFMENKFRFPDGSHGWFELSIEPAPQGVFILSIDITDRKIAELEMVENENRYRNLFENSPDALFINQNENVVLLNKACLDLFGAKSENELLGKSPFELFHPDFHTQLKDRIKKVKDLGEAVPVWELLIVTLSGELREVEARATAFDTKQARAIQVILRDITARKQAEEQLRQSEEKYRDLINGMNDTIWVIDYDTKILDVNNTAIDILGYSREELLSMKITDIDSSIDPEQIKNLAGSMPEEKVQVFETSHKAKDGRKIPVEISSSLVSYAGRTVIMSIARDISERKRAEKELRESEEKYRTVTESFESVLVTVDWDGVFHYANQAAAFAFNVAQEKLIGKNMYELFPPEVAEYQLKNVRQVISSGRGLTDEAETVVKGVPVWYRTSILPVISASGKAHLALVNTVDISERKQAEKTIIESEEKYRTVTESFESAIITVDMDGVFHYVNKAAAATFDMTPDMLIGKNMMDIFPPDVVKYQMQLVKEVISSGKGKINEAELNIKGLFRWYRTSFQPVLNTSGEARLALVNTVDITDRKLFETKLQESEERFRSLYENATIGIYRTTPEGQILLANPALVQMLGYESFEKLAERNLEKGGYKFNSTRSEFQKHVEENGQVSGFEAEWTRSDGSRLFIRESARAIKDSAGKVIYYEGTVEDISERKQAEEQLARLIERLDLATKSAEIGIWDWDIQKNQLVWDNRMFSLYGLQPEEFRSAYETWLNGVHPDDREYSNEISARAVNGEANYDTEFRVVWPDRSVHWIKAVGDVFRDENGKPLRMVGINYDITEHKKAESELTIALTKYKTLFDAFPQGITVTDQQGNILEANRSAEKLLGISREEQTEREIDGAEWQIIRTDGSPLPVDEYASVIALRENRKVENMEMGIVKADKSVTWINVTAAPLPLKEFGVVVTYGDISKRKKAEDKLWTNEQSFRVAIKPSAMILAQTDLDARYTWIHNPHPDFDPDGSLGKTDIEIADNEGTKKLFESKLQVIATGSGIQTEISFPVSDGYRTYDFAIEPLYDLNKKMVGVTTSAYDITERKQSEDRLKRNEQVLRLFVEHSPAAIAMFDREMNYIVTSRRYINDYRLNEQDLTGRSHYDVFPEMDEPRREIHRRCMAGEIFKQDEDPFPRADGTLDYVRYELRPWYEADASIGGLIFFSEVITERIKAEEALRQSERKLRLIADNTTDLIFAYDMDRKLFYVNDAIEKLTGYSVAELQEKNFIKWLHPEDEPRMMQLMEEVYKGNGFDSEEFRIITKDGKVKWSLSTWMPMLDEDGRQIGVQGRESNITQRKMVELNLRENEEKLSLFVEHAPASLAMFDTKMRYLAVSQRWKADYGLGDADLIGKSHYEIFPEIPKYWKNYHKRGLKGEVIKMEEDRFVRLDESVQWLRWEIRPWYTGDNKIGGIVVFTEDISDRIINKQISDSRLHLLEFANEHDMDEVIEETLNEAEKLTGSKIGFYHFVDDDQLALRLQNWSTATKEVFCQIGDAKGAHYPVDKAGVWADAIRDRKAVIHNDYASLSGKKGLPDGHAKVLREVVVPVIRNDKIKAILGIGNKDTDYSKQDVFILQGLADHAWETLERKRAEENLRESELKYRQLIENSGDAVFLYADNKFELMNARYEEMFGVKFEEAEKSGFNILDHVAPKSRDMVAERLKNISEGQENTPSYELTAINAAGKEIEVEARTSYLKYKGGIAVQGILRDITERKSLEEQLRQAQKMEAIGRLAGGVAHDFNNLLTIINGYSDLLTLTEIPEPMKDPIEQIRVAGQRATRLTSQLLAFSRKQVIQPKVLNLNDLVPEHLKMLGRLMGEDIEIATMLAAELPNIKADPGQMEQVIMNIVINARDAMPVGGKLTIETKAVDVDENYTSSHMEVVPGKFVMLAFSDTGMGMDEKTRSRIFEPFFTTKGRDKGTGLGLATVYGIVRQNGGFIYVYSELGKGTTFKIYFPAVADKQTDKKMSREDLLGLRGSETILLVEDDIGVMKITKRTLEGYGYNVLTATNGEEGLRVFSDHKQYIDLLLSDVIMPLMGGSEMAKQIKEINPSLKVIFFSGYTDDSIVNHGVLDEGVEFIQKPYSYLELAQRVRSVLDK